MKPAAIDRGLFQELYQVDLVHVPECWKLCGGGHCCNFKKYKAKSTQVLPLLPGELEYAGEFYSVQPSSIDRFDIKVGSETFPYTQINFDTDSCPCQHNLRPIMCRIYPLVPVFDRQCRLIGVDPYCSLFDVIEKFCGLDRSCKVEKVPLSELSKYIEFANLLGKSPVIVFYLSLYKAAKDFLEERLTRHFKADSGVQKIFSSLSLSIHFFLRDAEFSGRAQQLLKDFQEVHGQDFLASAK